VDWNSFWDVLSGAVLGVVAVVLAVSVTNRLAAERAEESARRERDLSTARDLYRVAGELFAAWKLWDFHSRKPGPGEAPYDDHRRSEMIQLAASAEGQCESLIVRIAQEHDMTTDRVAALWCLRTAFKELRYNIRKNHQLQWWATDKHGDDGYRHYAAYKNVLALVGTMVENPARKQKGLRDLLSRQRQTQPTEGEKKAKMEATKAITNHEAPLPVKPTYEGEEWVLVAEHLTLPYSAAEEDAPASARTTAPKTG
jgi:hypothetical protein